MSTILVLNLGSTSSKGAIYQNETQLHEMTLRHEASELKEFNSINDQLGYRQSKVEEWVKSVGYSMHDFAVFCVRGGVVKPIASGVYRINETMINDVKEERYGSHVSNVGMMIGYNWSQTYGKEAIFLNAPVTDELNPLARYTGVKGYERTSKFHALNQKQIAHEYALSVGKTVLDLSLIVCHMGGGISVGAHEKGSIIDVTNALDGEGPMSPERSGSLSAQNAIKLYESLHRDPKEFSKVIAGKGGLFSHLNSTDVKALVERAQSDPHTKEVIDAMVYQIAKEIGAMATVLSHPIDAILITGGLAYSKFLTDALIERVDWIAPVKLYPGEDELRALALGANRYLNGLEPLKTY